MKIKIIICVSALAMALQGVVFAAAPASVVAPVVAKTADSFCPDISQIQKNQMTQKWKAQTLDGTWKDYQGSFATNIIQFLGAQWTGVGVGQVTCVYKAEQRFMIQGNLTIQPALPVMLVFHTLTHQPVQGKWKRSADGVYNCYSLDQHDCPFEIRMETQTKNVYQEAESLKSSGDNAVQAESY